MQQGGRRRRHPDRLLTRYSHVRGETPPPRAGGAEGPVPEAGADAEIGGVVVVMRHMANPLAATASNMRTGK